MPKGDRTEGSRARPRTRSVRQRITLLMVIPLASLLGVWGFSTGTMLYTALQRLDFSGMYDRTGVPLGLLTQAIQDERDAALATLTAPGSPRAGRLTAQTATTDKAVATFRQVSRSKEVPEGLRETVSQRLRVLDGTFSALPSLRAGTNARSITPLQVIEGYSRIVDETFRLLTTLAAVDDVTVYLQSNSLLAVYWCRDFMMRQDLLLFSVRTARLKPADLAAFSRWAGSRDEFFEMARAGISGEVGGIIRKFAESPPHAAYLKMEARVVADGTAPDRGEWQTAVKTIKPQWEVASQMAGLVLKEKEIEPIREGILLRLYIAGGAGLLAVLLSIVLSLRFGRRLAGELQALQRTANHLAREQLPRVVARLRHGERVDVDAEAPRPTTARTQEIVTVSDAFDAVRRTAIETAVGEAEMRRSINRVFVNLSWRSQSLLHRQLRLLDQMERRAAGPQELEDLFRLDHLTTRMRRHAEGLVILSGAQTLRAWDHPVAAEELVRAAIAEVEDYTRVDLVGGAPAAVDGAAVADMIHLLAELIENATVFSPPNAEVTVKVDAVANGLAIEVVDRGIGMHPLERAELNRRLAEETEFNLADTDRLGLFVVARLAARHGVRISLQPSPYGGTTAVVLIPHALVTPTKDWQPQQQDGPVPIAAHRRRFDPPSPSALPASSHNGNARALAFSEAPDLNGSAQQPPPVPPPPPPSGPPPFPSQDGMESSEFTGRLPRRVRQRNLAPQLRGRHAVPDEPAPEDAPDDDPSPEFNRDLMSSLQSGWQRGRTGEEHGDDDPYDEWERP